ncbi:anti-sigma factor family protein [Evansella cellulosilytica]|uniref:Anti-sigma-W factor RsiW n=1 Tax=Evansella cellulosilytica (strain ATCC 21833 / DSM 2522 / FERM P-1141 / JCM 9156 / N-4) TaxID=649639 RepID=E6TTB8_EVAC2|nr:anti-sigma factor [Evansella cellulosilytica]ADU28458.1 putative transmembrane anti-sigma factor [Evansella cellulosilytica DSM 2522]
MACKKDYAEQIHHYLDEELTLLERKRFESHIQKCSACHAHVRELRKTEAIVQSASHIKAPANFTDNVMSQLPKQSQKARYKNWMRKHPYIITAATFFLVFIVSLTSIWNDGGKEISVKGDGHFIVDEERGVVIIPEGETISGDITVRNGNIEINGEVLGNITVINGEQYLASAGSVAGEIQEINQVLEWMWFHTKSFFSEVLNVMNGDKQ